MIRELEFHDYSELTMPHEAPGDGYGPLLERVVKGGEGHGARTDVGFFLRTRVRRDAAGKIENAHYAKILGDVYVNPRGEIEFTYYFNPRPNERNLEFDLEKNLLKDLDVVEQVHRP